MSVDIQFVNDAKATLLGDISAVAVSLVVQAGEGALFPGLSSLQYFYITLQNATGTREVVKVGARAGDTMGFLTRAQEGTSALAFSAGDKVDLRMTEQGLQDKIDQEIGDSNHSGTVFGVLTANSPEYQSAIPTAPAVLTLPTTDVRAGKRFVITNRASSIANGVRINSSNGEQVSYAPAAQGSQAGAVGQRPISVMVSADKGAPTGADDWVVILPPKGIIFMDEVNRTIATSSDGTSISLPADLLYADGMGLRIVAMGAAGAGASGNISLNLDGASIINYISGIREWRLAGEIIRRASSSQVVGGAVWVGIAGGVSGDVGALTDAADLTSILVLKLANLGASHTLEQDLFMVELF